MTGPVAFGSWPSVGKPVGGDGPKVCYLGNFAHAHCTEVHVARSLVALSASVLAVQEGTVRDRASWRRFVRAAAEADLLLWTRTWSTPTLTRTQWRELSAVCAKAGTVTVAFHLDRLWGLDREPLIRRDPFFRCQHVFTADGDPHPWTDAGVNHHWSPPAVVHDECGPGKRVGKWRGIDVAFVGSSIGYHDEWPRRQELIAKLRERFGSRFAVIGGRHAVRGRPLNDLLATVPVIAGDSLAPLREKSRYYSDRIPESLGRGGILVHPRIGAAAATVRGGVTWCGWDVADELEAIGLMLGMDARERAECRADGRAAVLEGHTYRHRLAAILETVGVSVPATAG